MFLRVIRDLRFGYVVVLLALLVIFTSVGVSAQTAKKEFPGRDIYPSVSVLELDEFYRQFDEVITVDVRSAYEHETLRVKGALNIPLSSPNYISEMRKLRASDPRPIVVYCNGKTCMKSYKAALKCSINKIDNVHSYDAGIMDWAKKYPKLSTLLGKSPIDPSKLISKKEFKRHLLTPDAYGEHVATTSAIVLDVRDRFQREALSMFVGRERRAYLDDKRSLDRYIAKAKRERKSILVHDAAGKQVRWLQYYLKDRGVRNFYFMEGGIAAYYAQMKNDFIR